MRIELKSSGEKFSLSCCDCGLVHEIAVAIEKDGKIGMVIRRDQKRTEQRRSKMVIRSILWKIIRPKRNVVS